MPQDLINSLIELEKKIRSLINEAESIMGALKSRQGLEGYLDLSTAHMTQKDIAIIESSMNVSGSLLPFVAYPTADYGWFVHLAWGSEDDVASHFEEMVALGFSPQFQALVRAGQEKGAAFLRLDGDGPCLDEFPLAHEDALATEYKDEPHVQVEYDLSFTGGDFCGVGTRLLIPMSLVDEKGGIEEAFRFFSGGIDPVHIVHYSLDEMYNLKGEFYEPAGNLTPGV